MARSNLGRRLVEGFLEQIQEVEAHIGGGGCPDYPSYRQQVGFVLGLKMALTILDDHERED